MACILISACGSLLFVLKLFESGQSLKSNFKVGQWPAPNLDFLLSVPLLTVCYHNSAMCVSFAEYVGPEGANCMQLIIQKYNTSTSNTLNACNTEGSNSMQLIIQLYNTRRSNVI